jgi:hypothetical protein
MDGLRHKTGSLDLISPPIHIFIFTNATWSTYLGKSIHDDDSLAHGSQSLRCIVVSPRRWSWQNANIAHCHVGQTIAQGMNSPRFLLSCSRDKTCRCGGTGQEPHLGANPKWCNRLSGLDCKFQISSIDFLGRSQTSVAELIQCRKRRELAFNQSETRRFWFVDGGFDGANCNRVSLVGIRGDFARSPTTSKEIKGCYSNASSLAATNKPICSRKKAAEDQTQRTYSLHHRSRRRRRRREKEKCGKSYCSVNVSVLKPVDWLFVLVSV